MEAEITTGLEAANATDLVANPEEIEAVVTHQEIPNDAAMETIGSLKDRSADHRQPVGYRNPRKRRNKDNVVRGTPIGRTFVNRRRV
jgi:hypothetical protein